MLKFMREKFRHSLALKIILIAVAASFAGFGIGTSVNSSRSGNIIAQVLNQKITRQEFQTYYNNLVESYRRQMGERFSPELLERLDLKGGAFNNLARQKMQLSVALEKGIRVSDEELAKGIRSNPVFHRDGAFDKQLYINILNANRLTPTQYEESLREPAIIDKLRLLITDSVKVSDLEARWAFVKENEKAKVDYVIFEGFEYRKQIEPSEEDLKEYYQENSESFKKSESVRIKYLKFAPQDFMEKMEVADQQAEAYYQDNSDEFRQEEKVKARHILIKVPQEASEKDAGEALKKAEELLEKIRKGEDFAGLAKQFSQDDGSKDKGGDLGLFSRGQMVKPFEEVAFSLEPGQVGDIVRSTFGYHIIKVEERQKDRLEPFDSAKKGIVEKLKKTLAVDAAEEQAYNLSYDITAEDFDEIAAEQDLKPQITDWIFKNKPIKGIPGSQKMAEHAFKLQSGDISKALEAGGAYYVFLLTDEREPYVPEPEEVKDQVKSRYLSKKSGELAQEAAKEALAQLKAGKTLKTVTEGLGLMAKETDYFNRSGSPKGVGRNQKFIEEAFKLKEGRSEMVSYGSRFYVITRTGSEGIEEADFQEKKEEFTKELLGKKRNLMYSIWVTRSMDRISINIMDGFSL